MHIIILSGRIHEDGSLTPATAARLDYGIALFRKERAARLLLSGGWHPGQHQPMSQARAMLQIAKEHIPEESILLEERSKDTVGQAVFIRMLFGNLDTFTLVTHESHMQRAKEIFAFVFPAAAIACAAVPNHAADDTELRSLEAFRKTFNGIPPGDIEQIIGRLYSSHVLYKGADKHLTND